MDLDRALAFVREHRIVPFTDVKGEGASFVRFVAGGPVRGSWWGHPKGHEIFRLAGALEASGEVLILKLLGGKETILHRALWPALARVVTDEGWRAARAARLGAAARRLLDAVEGAPGPLRLDEHARALRLDRDGRRALSRARLDLERALLVHATEVHTERGAHATVLEPWPRWVARTPGLAGEAAKLDLGEAMEALRLP